MRAFVRFRLAIFIALLVQVGGLQAFQGSLAVQPLSNPLATFGLPYTANMSASGGAPPYAFQVGVGQGSLPPGISMSPNGALSGSPSAEGFFRFTVNVTDSTNANASAEILIAVNPPWNPEPMPGAVVGQPYSHSVLRSGLSVPYPVMQQSGAIPAGLQLSSNGVVSGIPTAAPSTYQFVVNSTITPSTIAIRTITVTSNPVSGPNAPDIVGGQLADGKRGLLYAYQFQASSGIPPYRFTLAQGALPPGVGLQDSGSLSGVPGVAGTYQFRVRVTGLNGSYSEAGYVLRIIEPSITLSGGELPVATISRPYSAQVSAAGGVAPVRYILLGSVLPPNLQFDASGKISGTPNTGGTFDLIVQAIDVNNESATGRYTLRIVRPDFRITDSRLPAGRRGEAYSFALRTADGTAPYLFNLAQGSALPQGLTLSPAGLIAGTPLAVGDFNFSITAVDAQGYTTTSTITLNIAPSRLSILNSSLPPPALGQRYSSSIQLTGGTAPYQFSVFAGTLPPGLSLAAATGIIDGIPTTQGSFTFTLRVIDGASQTADQLFTVTVVPPQPLSLSSSLPSPALHAAYNLKLEAQGGTSPYSYRLLDGSLPPGVTLDATGSFSGRPLVPGSFSFTVQASDAANANASVRVAWRIPQPALLPTGSTARDYSASLDSQVSGGLSALLLDSASLAPLPAGLILASDNRITGRPLLPGLHSFSLRSGTGEQYSFLLPIEGETFQISSVAVPPARLGSPYNFNLVAEGGREFYRWRLREGSLPSGMVLDPIVGRLEGIPQSVGAFVFTAEATGQDGRAAARQFVLTVGPTHLPLVSAVTNAASYAAGGVAPGELLTLFGEALGPDAKLYLDGILAPVIYSFPNQSSVVAPFGLRDLGYTQLHVERQGISSLAFAMKVLPAKPGLFAINGSGRGQGAILNQNGSINSQANPAAQGSVVVLYATGGGTMNPDGVDGTAAATTSALVLPARVEVNGQNASLLYAGNAPGLLHGVIQVNVQLPAGLPSGSVGIVLSVGPHRAPSGVTLWVE